MTKRKRSGLWAIFQPILITVFMLTILSIGINCNKQENISQAEIEKEMGMNLRKDGTMNPGPDPKFEEFEKMGGSVFRTVPLEINTNWERYMYVDKTDTMYLNTSSTKRFAGYLKRYGFTGVYMYSTSSIIQSSSNYSGFARFIKTLSDSGVVYRAICSGSSTAFGSSGTVANYNNSRSFTSEKINRANLELEWWNGVTTWSNWNLTNQRVNSGSLPDNDFYEGWYKNLGSTVDTVAARDQVRFSDRILLHCYQNGVPTYSYANARSTGATGGRLDIIASGARQAGRKIDVYIIISAENTAWGASNTFSGPVLQNAYLAGYPNPFVQIESQVYSDISSRMTTLQRQWINIKGFVWFTKRYCYRAVPPL